jgi:putative transposase
VGISHLEFIVHLIFNFFTDNKQSSLEGMRRALKAATEKSISKAAFWERLAGERLRKIMESLVAELIKNSIGSALSNHQILELLKISGIYIFDSSTIILKDLAKKHFPGAGDYSGIKWHNCFDLISGTTKWFKLSESRKHDSNFFPPLELLKGKLIIFDLGYFAYQLLADLHESGAYFLCRLKSNSLVFIEEIVTGFKAKDVGKSLLSVCKANKFKGDVIEANVKTTLKNNNVMRCRAIGFWNKSEKCYHWYLTNLQVEAKIIYPLYRLRWQIELIFKACKNSLNANAISSANKNIIQTLLLASIAAHLTTETIYEVASNALSEEKCLAITAQRVAFILVNLKDKFIKCFLNPITENMKILIDAILHMKDDLYDPNYKKRETSKARVLRVATTI